MIAQLPPPSRAPRVLWADPEPQAVESHVLALRRAGFEVTCVGSLGELQAPRAGEAFDLIVLEPAWPGEDGLAACQALSGGGVPVLACSRQASPLDCVASLEAGADDFLPASAHHAELTARARCLLRRRGSPAAPREQVWTYDRGLGRLCGPSGRWVGLSARCAALFGALVERPGAPLPRAAIEARLYGGEAVAARTIDVAVARLRRVIDDCDGAGRFIRSVHSVGYAFDIDPGCRLDVQGQPAAERWRGAA